MHTSWHAIGPGVVASLVLACSACGFQEPGSSQEAARTQLSSQPPGEYGTPLDSGRPDPTDVATDVPAPEEPAAATTVLISYFGWNATSGAVEVGGFASVVESGGTCTLTMTKGPATVTTSSTAVADVSTSACGQQTVPGDRLAPGSWTAVLTYESDTSHGVSEPVQVQVP